jgi:hypothetical protein
MRDKYKMVICKQLDCDEQKHNDCQHGKAHIAEDLSGLLNSHPELKYCDCTTKLSEYGNCYCEVIDD